MQPYRHHLGSCAQGMEGSGEPVSPFDSYVDLNPQALMVDGPRAAAQSIPAATGGASVTSAPARMASLEAMSPHAASPSSTGAESAALSASLQSILHV